MKNSLAGELKRCRREGRALLAINVFSYDSFAALTGVFGATATPVIAQFSAKFFCRQSPVTVARWREALGCRNLWLHLDHCTDRTLIAACAAAGFDSVMFDGSHGDLARNIRDSRAAVAVAKRANPRVLVECEIGPVPGVEDGAGSERPSSGSLGLAEVVEFHRAVQPDLLAVGFGNMHGHYRGDERFDLALMRQVGDALRRTPLVLHGGSGMDVKIVRRLVEWGHCKINISTDLKSAWMDALRQAAHTAGSPLEAQEIVATATVRQLERLRMKYHRFGGG
jgi:fructose-bisphosphate aldolase class II